MDNTAHTLMSAIGDLQRQGVQTLQLIGQLGEQYAELTRAKESMAAELTQMGLRVTRLEQVQPDSTTPQHRSTTAPNSMTQEQQLEEATKRIRNESAFVVCFTGNDTAEIAEQEEMVRSIMKQPATTTINLGPSKNNSARTKVWFNSAAMKDAALTLQDRRTLASRGVYQRSADPQTAQPPNTGRAAHRQAAQVSKLQGAGDRHQTAGPAPHRIWQQEEAGPQRLHRR